MSTKREIVKKQVRQDVWDVMKRTYRITADKPQSGRQDDFLNSVADYICDKFASKLKRKDIEQVFSIQDIEQ